MYNITPELLREVAGAKVSGKVVADLAKYLPKALEKYEINTDLRLAHFLAQIAHESDHFRTLQEYASGREYEGRRDLGNVYRGDGVRYKGRGVIQLTGRNNYRRYGQILDFDLEGNPELAATPEVSVLTALEYWKQRGLNQFADDDNVKQITRKINGGYNGLQNRREMLARAKHAIRHMKPKFVQEKVSIPKANTTVTNVANTSSKVEPPIAKENIDGRVSP